MRLGKRKLLVAVLAALAISAIVGPAMALAAVWKDGASTVSTSFSMGLTGGENYEVETSAGGVQCNEHMTLSYNATSKATTISAFENKGCSTPFGTYAKCTVQTVEAIGLPWSVTLGTSTLTINSMHMKHTFKTGCAKGEINQTISVPISLTSPAAITGMEFFVLSGTYKQFGSFTVDSPNSGTYGIG
jgi:hypothetical protein